MNKFVIQDIGRTTYEKALTIQQEALAAVAGGAPNCLIFTEHDPVLTLGANFHEENLLFPIEEYERRGIHVVKTDRGGDVTFHNLGQLVIYPVFNTDICDRDLHRWLRGLEETIIRACSDLGVSARRFPPHTGAWVEDRKIAAIGVKVKRWVSMHGIALNCNNDLEPFSWIVPCGIKDFGVTSLTEELGRTVGAAEARPLVHRAFASVFS